MAKRVARRPDWLRAVGVEAIYSVSGCMSESFADYIPYWRHNGYWLFDAVESIHALAREHSIRLADCQVFYYEVFELEFDARTGQWQAFEPDRSFRTAVVPPTESRLEGYDVVTFSAHASPECSPLSCNRLAETVRANARCLLASLDEARRALEGGAFDQAEPGPFRIFAVYSVVQA